METRYVKKLPSSFFDQVRNFICIYRDVTIAINIHTPIKSTPTLLMHLHTYQDLALHLYPFPHLMLAKLKHDLYTNEQGSAGEEEICNA